MIIVICDCCNQQVTGGSCQTIQVEGQHGLAYVFDVGPCCLDEPFKVPSSARTVRRLRKATSKVDHG